LQEAMEDGSLRFQIIEDGNGVKGFCDGLAQTCVPSNLNKFSYKNPDDIPIVLMTYNQHKYDTEGVGQSAYENTESDPQPIQSEISADLTQNVPGTTEPSMREECKNAAKSGASLPSLSSGCIDAANPHLDAPIPSHCATDFLGPLSPSQDQTCSKHSEVRKSAESHEFLFNKPASSKAKNSDDEETEVKDTDQTVSDDRSKDAAENDADIVGNDAEEALKIGLVNHIYDSEHLEEETLKLAHIIANKSSNTIKIAKATVRAAFENTLKKGIEIEAEAFANIFDTKDAQIGVSAFIERKQPEWQHE